MAEYEYPVQPRKTWPRLVVIFGLLILLGILVWILLFRNATAKDVSGGQQLPPTSQPSTTRQSSPNTVQDTPKNTTASPTTANSQPTQTLTNAGPGNMQLLFLGAFLAGAIGYRLFIRFRAAHS